MAPHAHREPSFRIATVWLSPASTIFQIETHATRTSVTSDSPIHPEPLTTTQF